MEEEEEVHGCQMANLLGEVDEKRKTEMGLVGEI